MHKHRFVMRFDDGEVDFKHQIDSDYHDHPGGFSFHEHEDVEMGAEAEACCGDPDGCQRADCPDPDAVRGPDTTLLLFAEDGSEVNPGFYNSYQ